MVGFPKELISKPGLANRFLCCICNLVLRDAVQNACGHRYCDQCVKQVLQRFDLVERRCPGCSLNFTECMLYEDQIYPDFAARKDLRTVEVKCINESCLWNGTFQEYIQDHENSCPYSTVKCLKSGCAKTMNRGYLKHHMEKECPMRLIECRNCKEQHPFRETKKHVSQCPEVLVSCNNCNKRIPKSQMEKHIDESNGDCAKRKMKCILNPVGCTHKVIAADMSAHLGSDNIKHTELIVRAVTDLQHTCRRITLCNGDGPSGYNTEITTQMTLLNQEVEEKLDVLRRSSNERNEELRSLIALLDKRTEVYQNVLAAVSNELVAANSKVTLQEQHIKYVKEVIDKLEKKVQTQEDIAMVKNIELAEQNLRIQAHDEASYDGVLIWKITDMKRRKEDAVSNKTTSFYSQAFYTHRHGYRLCARLYPNGDGVGKGSNVSLFFVVMRGCYDALLTWPFQHKVTFMLLDQSSDHDHIQDAFRPDPSSSSFKRPTTEMNIASGCPLFADQKTLETGHKYIKDDTMFIKVVISATKMNPLKSGERP